MPNNGIKPGTKFFPLRNRSTLSAALRAAFFSSGMSGPQIAETIGMDTHVVQALVHDLPRSITEYRLEALKKLAKELGISVAIEVGAATSAPIGRGTPKKKPSRRKARSAKAEPVVEPVAESVIPPIAEPVAKPAPVPDVRLQKVVQVLELVNTGVLTTDEATSVISRLVKQA